MLRVFETMQGKEVFFAGTISGSVMSALITTAAGLAAAIPCYLGHNYLVTRVNAITLDMEKAALEITAFFSRSAEDKKEAEAGTEEA
jgi:biopolymer transport protein ExbB